MSGNLRLKGSTSGYSQLSAPDVAGDQTFTFPTVGGTLMTTNQSTDPTGLWVQTGIVLSPATVGNKLDMGNASISGGNGIFATVSTGDSQPWTDPTNLSGSNLESGALLLYRNVTDGSGAFLAGYNANGTPVVNVKTDGSATFADDVSVGNTSPVVNSNTGGSILYGGSGGLRVFRSTSGVSNAIDCQNNNVEVFGLKTDGSAVFTGTITSEGRDVPTYQQGIWTPTCVDGSLTATSSQWVRVGQLVTLKANLASFTNTASDNGNTIDIISLPYNVSLSQAAGSCMYLAAKPGYTTTYVTYSNTHNNGILQFYNTNDANAWDVLKHSNLTSNSSFYLTATYITDDNTWTPENGATVS